MNWDGLNRRKFPRVNYPCLIVISSDEKEDDVLLTHTDNIGIGGICVSLKKELKRFAKVNIELDLLDLESHIKCQGKVVWSVQRTSGTKRKPVFFDLGIEFEDISDAARKRIEKVVDKLTRAGTSPAAT